MFEIADIDRRPPECGRIVMLPDIQNYTGHGGAYIHVLEETIDWIIGEHERLDIGLVVQVGDLTDHNLPDEWQRARRAFARLDGVLPYVVTVGNHDLGESFVGESRATFFNDHFQIHQNPLNEAAFLGGWQDGRLENAAYRVSLKGHDWLVLALEFGPREGAVAWADGVLSAHRGTPTLVVTHEFIDELSRWETGEVRRSTPDTFNSPYRYAIAEEEGGIHCGEELWQHLIKHHPQIRLVLNGHYRPFTRRLGKIVEAPGLAEARLGGLHADGSPIEQLMFNVQWEKRGGNGWLLMLGLDRVGVAAIGKYSPVALCTR